MTIYDVAKEAGVSIATVSRVLNGSSTVSLKTKEKVLAVMKKQNYQPNPFARGLGLNSMKMIGVICADVSDAFYAKAVSLIEEYSRQMDWNVLLTCTGYGNNEKYKFLEFLLNKHIDALIIIGTPFVHKKDLRYLKKTGEEIPVIMINSYMDLPNVYGIVCDEEAAVQNAVGKLHQQGVGAIVYFYDSLTYSGRQKLAGYRNGIKKYYLNNEPGLEYKVEKSFEQMNESINQLIVDNIIFDAVIASEDILAIAAQKILWQNNKKIPVIGCNNSILAQCSTPALSSIDNRLDILCKEAIDILTKLINNEAVPKKMMFTANLVERESFRSK